MITAGVYARKSTDEGEKAADAKSVARQVQRAREYAAKRGWRFDEKFIFTDDGVSGAEFRNRPGLNALLAAVKGKHALNALVVSEQSRLGRDTIRTLALIQVLADADVRIWSYLEDRPITLDDELGEIEQFMKSWAGASERRKPRRDRRAQGAAGPSRGHAGPILSRARAPRAGSCTPADVHSTGIRDRGRNPEVRNLITTS
jgi:DNA invertase Pin-like site-specific DNA recombinase